ncbi:Cation transporter [Dillenia turbinata]|uniref:Cation transporter n=1 Tax=Dillenia turbinata TaxID=194707 RepID=A0AAN8ZU04_9MAGN
MGASSWPSESEGGTVSAMMINKGILLGFIPSGDSQASVLFHYTFVKQEESKYLLNHEDDVGYLHLLPRLHSSFLLITVLGFIVIQVVVFCSTEWYSEALRGLNSYQKIIGGLFQSENSRHAGETIVDLSTVALPSWYLPPYTSFLPIKDKEEASRYGGEKKKRRGKLLENLAFSQLSYLVIFVILVCITERKKLKEDPLNFDVLNIVLEVIGAYGNVGFSVGYSCERQLHPPSGCLDKWIGFSGKWSDGGKIILILVMILTKRGKKKCRYVCN